MKEGIIKKAQKEILYEIHKKSKKNIILRITEDGKAKLSIPKYSPYRVGEDLIRINFDKIYIKVNERKKIYREKQDSSHIKILGKDIEKKSEKSGDILLRFAKKEYNELLNKWIPKIGISPARVKIKDMKSAWGICYSNKNITLNLKLIQMDIKIVEYVIVHELCHLHHMNHSKDFWNLVESHLPDFKVERARLKKLQKDKNYFI